MKLNRLDDKQRAVLSLVTDRDAAGIDGLLKIETVLAEIGEIQKLSSLVSEVVDIAAETGADAYQIVDVLSLVRAATYGEVLSVDFIKVELDDVNRDGLADIEVDEGVFILVGGGLAVFCRQRRQYYLLMGAAGCASWGTTPEQLAEHVDAVFISLENGGDFDARIFKDEIELDRCVTIEEFFGEEDVS